MSFDWVKDIAEMQYKYGVKAWMLENQDDKEKMRKYLEFRINFLREELDETQKAFAESDPEEIVDGLIDLCVVAIGTLDAYGINPYTAWDQVLKANMNKEVGVKPGRPNPLGLPDLIKPAGWTSPDHSDNTGILTRVFNK